MLGFRYGIIAIKDIQRINTQLLAEMIHMSKT